LFYTTKGFIFTAFVKIINLLRKLPHSLALHHSTKGDQIKTSFAIGENLKQFLIATEGTFWRLLVTCCTNMFNIQQLYVLPTPYLIVLNLSENKQRLEPLTA